METKINNNMITEWIKNQVLEEEEWEEDGGWRCGAVRRWEGTRRCHDIHAVLLSRCLLYSSRVLALGICLVRVFKGVYVTAGFSPHMTNTSRP